MDRAQPKLRVADVAVTRDIDLHRATRCAGGVLAYYHREVEIGGIRRISSDRNGYRTKNVTACDADNYGQQQRYKRRPSPDSSRQSAEEFPVPSVHEQEFSILLGSRKMR
jgi:hypothetical protein